jgi:hypothetical protein
MWFSVMRQCVEMAWQCSFVLRKGATMTVRMYPPHVLTIMWYTGQLSWICRLRCRARCLRNTGNLLASEALRARVLEFVRFSRSRASRNAVTFE